MEHKKGPSHTAHTVDYKKREKAISWDIEAPKRKPKGDKKEILPYVFLVIALLSLALLVRPALVGYTIHDPAAESSVSEQVPLLPAPTQDTNFEEYQSQLLVKHADLSSCEAQNGQLLDEIEKYFDMFGECKGELAVAINQKNANAYQDTEQIDDLKNEIDKLEKELEDEKDDNEKYLEEARLEKEKAEDRLEDLQKEHNDLQSEFNSLDDLQSDYDALAYSSARNICCKERVDDPQINAYTIQDNKVVCLTSGGNSLTC